jgi:type II secretory pathway component GspD/PulD (secretin)
MTAQASAKMWPDLRRALESLVVEGDFALMPSTGDVIITAPRDVMDRVEPIVSKLRAVASRQVTVNLTIVSYDSEQQDAYALDLAAVFQDAGFQVAFTGPAALSNVAGAGSYSTGFISPPPANASSAAQKWAGTKATLQALSANNRLSVEYASRSQGYLGSVTGATSIGNVTLAGGASLSFALSGYTLIAIPRVLDDGRISLALGYSSASDATFVPVTSGQGVGSITLQSPDQTNQATGQFPVVRSGDTFVITGFAQDRRVLNESGVGWFWNFMLGGGENAVRKRQRFALLVTPLQIDDEPASGSTAALGNAN